MKATLRIKKQRATLMTNEIRYSKLFSNMSQGIIVIKTIYNPGKKHKNYYIANVNYVFEKLTNTSREELIGKTLTDIKDQVDICIINSFKKLIEEESQKSFEYYSQKLNKFFDLITYRCSEDEIVLLISDVTKKHTNDSLLRKQLMDTVITMGRMIEKRDLYTAGHQKKVAYLAYKIASEIGLNQERIEGLYIAALLHDIGKIGIPLEILTKPDKLTILEFEIIKNHVQIAYDILSEVKFPWPVANIVLQHHEKTNGMGYPNGLTGDEISLEAKILSVADVVEALTAHRPYRPSLGLDYALLEIRKYKGIYYEPEIVNACIRVCSKNNWDNMINEALTNSFLSILNI